MWVKTKYYIDSHNINKVLIYVSWDYLFYKREGQEQIWFMNLKSLSENKVIEYGEGERELERV